jgi:alkylation response protein AidB-like acyl-CoA dehydrogenase
MDAYFLALLLLSVGAFIEARCSVPGLRPADPTADRAFRILGRSAFAVWLAMLAWGLWRLAWWQPLAGLVGSLAANALVLQAGARPYWPGAAMGLALAGLFVASWVLTR